MRMSCNGCRVLRKGCSDDCIIRPCLQWIASPDSQANATIFLAKFYGRAGLFNLITAGSEHLRPAIFKSLLYEACGRMVNPVYGSVGLLCSGNWESCQAAVDAVLTGSMNVETNADPSSHATVSLKCCDIRHVCNHANLGSSRELRKVKDRSRFKKPDHHRTKPKVGGGPAVEEPKANGRQVETETETETTEVLMMSRARKTSGGLRNVGDVELELTLNSAQ